MRSFSARPDALFEEQFYAVAADDVGLNAAVLPIGNFVSRRDGYLLCRHYSTGNRRVLSFTVAGRFCRRHPRPLRRTTTLRKRSAVIKSFCDCFGGGNRRLQSAGDGSSFDPGSYAVGSVFAVIILLARTRGIDRLSRPRFCDLYGLRANLQSLYLIHVPVVMVCTHILLQFVDNTAANVGLIILPACFACDLNGLDFFICSLNDDS